MQKIYITLYVLITIITHTIASKPTLICIAGPSCSGKSTLSEQLSKKYDEYTLLEYDSIEESMGRKTPREVIFQTLMEHAAALIDQNQSVIIDTNTLFYNHMQTLPDKATIIYVYIYAPLKILLERDAKRNLDSKRNKIQAQRAKEFVIHNFYAFYPDGIPVDGQYTINSHILDTENAVDMVINYLQSINSSSKN